MASDIKLNDNGVVVEGGELHSAGPVGGFSFADRTMGNAGRWVLYAHAGLARLWSQVAGDKVVIHSNGNVGIGTPNPARTLHVEGNEIHSGGPGTGFSFSDRTKPALVDNPQNGERWVWYAHEGKARLWSGRDVLVIADDGPRAGGLPELRIEGDVHVGGKLSGGHVSRLDGTETSFPAPTPIKRVSVYANTIAFDGSRGKPEKYGLHTDFENGKEVLVLNFPPNPYGKSFKDGVRIEGNVQVTGALTQASSITLKENVAQLSTQQAIAALQGLTAVTFSYKADEQKEQHVGFIAENVPDLVAKSDHKSVSAMDIVAVLTKVVQEQQKTMADLAAEVSALKARRI